MHSAKVAISLESALLSKLDAFVKKRLFSSRSQGIQIAIREKIDRLERGRLAVECAKLDRKQEQALAEEYFAGEDVSEWPKY